MQQPTDPPMFVRAAIDGIYYDIAIADINAMEVPQSPHHAVHIIVGGLHGTINAQSYQVVHAAWVARRRSAAGR